MRDVGVMDAIEVKKMSVEEWLDLNIQCDFVHLDISNTGRSLVNFFKNVKGKPFILFEGGSTERDENMWVIKYKKSKITETLKEHGFSYELLKSNNYEHKGQKVYRSLSCIDLNTPNALNLPK